MAGLLVSVRSAEEARAALIGGAAIIDVKEPGRGPLGRASCATWRAVRAAVAGRVAVSVALGELRDFEPAEIPAPAWDGIAFRKVGPAGLGDRWANRWRRLIEGSGIGPPWVAVIYADYRVAEAPPPDLILDIALETPGCRGVLVDSWDKGTGCPLRDLAEWRDRVDRVRATGRFVALAGRLSAAEMDRLTPLDPDYFAVRGAACANLDRAGVVEADRVAALVEAAGRPRSSGAVAWAVSHLPTP